MSAVGRAMFGLGEDTPVYGHIVSSVQSLPEWRLSTEQVPEPWVSESGDTVTVHNTFISLVNAEDEEFVKSLRRCRSCDAMIQDTEGARERRSSTIDLLSPMDRSPSEPFKKNGPSPVLLGRVRSKSRTGRVDEDCAACEQPDGKHNKDGMPMQSATSNRSNQQRHQVQHPQQHEHQQQASGLKHIREKSASKQLLLPADALRKAQQLAQRACAMTSSYVSQAQSGNVPSPRSANSRGSKGKPQSFMCDDNSPIRNRGKSTQQSSSSSESPPAATRRFARRSKSPMSPAVSTAPPASPTMGSPTSSSWERSRPTSPASPTPAPAPSPTSEFSWILSGSGSAQQRTTFMVQGLDCTYTQDTLLADLVAASFGPPRIDFLYLPFHFGERTSQGYCFINFADPLIAGTFVGCYHCRAFGRYSSNVRMMLADRQGAAANVERLRRKCAKITNPRYRPLVLDGDELVPLQVTSSKARRDGDQA